MSAEPETLAIDEAAPLTPTVPSAQTDATTPRPSPRPDDDAAKNDPVSAPDTLDSKPPSTAQQVLQQSLSRSNFETEVGQVMGSLNSWWGGVKKQSASALTSIKADIDKTVTQAQADLEYLRTAKVEIVRKSEDEQGEARAEAKGKTRDEDANVASDQTHGIFDRLASSTNQLQQSLQQTFQFTLASAASNPAISNPSQLRAHLAENLRLSSARENLQLSMKQAEKMAEDYLRKGDQWVKDAEKWMGDAVKVVPPDDETRFYASSFDGGDFYSFSTSTPTTAAGPTSESSTRPSAVALAVGSRKDGLLTRLREDKSLLLVDPLGEAETPERRREFSDWVDKAWPAAEIKDKEQEIGNVGGIRMSLVPEHLSDEQFWQRYLFHKHMIEAEDEKRKKLLAVTQQQQQQDDFSWDDEPEEGPVDTKAPDRQMVPKTNEPEAAKPPLGAASTSTSTSPRDSEESYDLVSDQGGKAAAKANASNDDDDSDWE